MNHNDPSILSVAITAILLEPPTLQISSVAAPLVNLSFRIQATHYRSVNISVCLVRDAITSAQVAAWPLVIQSVALNSSHALSTCAANLAWNPALPPPTLNAEIVYTIGRSDPKDYRAISASATLADFTLVAGSTEFLPLLAPVHMPCVRLTYSMYDRKNKK